MSKKTKYRQCRLERRVGTRRIEQVTHLPEEFAVVGRVLKLKDEGKWTDGWRVLTAGELVEPPDIHKMIRGHRENTGDSLPK